MDSVKSLVNIENLTVDILSYSGRHSDFYKMIKNVSNLVHC